LTAFALALALLTPWHAVGAAARSAEQLSLPGGEEHRADCALFASHRQAGPAQVRKATPHAQSDADSSPGDRVRVMTVARRLTVALRAPAVPSPPLYLRNLRLLR
jgi:hypothetical protein